MRLRVGEQVNVNRLGRRRDAEDPHQLRLQLLQFGQQRLVILERKRRLANERPALPRVDPVLGSLS